MRCSGATTTGPETAVAYPNPFVSRATIAFETARAAEARLTVYDALGRSVAVLSDGFLRAGSHEVVFDATALPAGLYVWRLELEGRVETGWITRLR